MTAAGPARRPEPFHSDCRRAPLPTRTAPAKLVYVVLKSKLRPAILAAALLTACSPNPAARVSEIPLGADAPPDRLLSGCYEPEESWRWTAPSFTLRLDPPETDGPVFVELDFTFPQEVAREQPSLVLTATVNGLDAGSREYRRPGRYLFSVQAPAGLPKDEPWEVTFETSGPVQLGGRPVGLIAVSAALRELEQSAGYKQQQLEKARAGYEELLRRRHARLPIEKQKELMRLFHDLGVWDHLWFQDVRIIKNPLDLWMMQQIIYEVQPDFVIETGAWYGGSALYWAFVLEGMGLTSSRVFTIDVNDHTAAARAHRLWKKYVRFFHGSSLDPAISGEIARLVRGKKVLVTLDSDHSMRHVLRELKTYAPLVSPGSYIVVEDTHYDAVPTRPEQGPGPMAAVQAFLASPEGAGFEQDLAREALILTFNPGGWLRRKPEQ